MQYLPFTCCHTSWGMGGGLQRASCAWHFSIVGWSCCLRAGVGVVLWSVGAVARHVLLTRACATRCTIAPTTIRCAPRQLQDSGDGRADGVVRHGDGRQAPDDRVGPPPTPSYPPTHSSSFAPLLSARAMLTCHAPHLLDWHWHCVAGRLPSEGCCLCANGRTHLAKGCRQVEH